MKSILVIYLQLFFSVVLLAQAPVQESPIISEGEGPFSQLILRGATLINSTGAPPIGPVDIVIENNTIVDIKTVGYPGVEIDSTRRPQLKEGGHEIDAEGKYILPGLIDMHGHICLLYTSPSPRDRG